MGLSNSARRVVAVSFLEDGSLSCSDGSGPCACKFVVIDDAVRLHVVFGEVVRFPYHALLVVKFCERESIACGWQQRPDMAEIYDPSVKIKGGGMIDIDSRTKRARVYGASRAYGFFRPGEVVRALRSSDLFDDYEIEIADGG